MGHTLKMYILILVCMFVPSFARNVPVKSPATYNRQSLRNIVNRPYYDNDYMDNDYMDKDYTYADNLNMDPGDYEINVDHQKYIPMIDGRPIYLPPIIKSNNEMSIKQYPKDKRPWHYWQNTQMPKHSYATQKKNNFMKTPTFNVGNYNLKYREYPHADHKYEIKNSEVKITPGLIGNVKIKDQSNKYYGSAKHPSNKNLNKKNEALTYDPYLNSKLVQNRDVAFNDKVGEILPPYDSDYKANDGSLSFYPKNDSKKMGEANKKKIYQSSKEKDLVGLKEHEQILDKLDILSNESKEPETVSANEDSPVNTVDFQENMDVDYSVIQERNNCENCDNESQNSVDLEQEDTKKKFLNTIDSKFRSLVFNPSAKSTDKFQACVTPKNESGSCRYIQHCLLPSIIGAIGQFMNYVCIIDDRFIGVCCPEYPAATIKVEWDSNELDGTDNSTVTMPEACGVSSRTRIVGGEKADPKDYPWMAALLTMSSGQFYCGGSLINNRYVLTAAHCTFGIPRNQILVRLGEYDFSDKEGSPGEDFPVIEIKRHGQYSRRTLNNDIALLKLAKPVAFKSNIKTICLPGNKTFEKVNATLAGWGNVKGGGPNSGVLLEATFPVVDNKKCADTHGLPVPKDAICTLATPHDKGACNGDSGGPLMVLDEESKHWYVVGVVSWGRRGCDPKFPTVYAGVSNYKDWIETHAV